MQTIHWLKSRLSRTAAALLILGGAVGCTQDQQMTKRGSLNPLRVHPQTGANAQGAATQQNAIGNNAAMTNPAGVPGQTAQQRMGEWNHRPDPRSAGTTPLGTPARPDNLSGSPASFNAPPATGNTTAPAAVPNQTNYQSSAIPKGSHFTPASGEVPQPVHTIHPDQVGKVSPASAATVPSLETPDLKLPELSPPTGTAHSSAMPAMDPLAGQEMTPATSPKVISEFRGGKRTAPGSIPPPVMLPEAPVNGGVAPAPITLPRD